MHPTRKPLSPGLKSAVTVTAAIDLIIGLMFLFAPELGFTLWPTPIAPVLSRFIGSIIVANGVGAWLVVRQGTLGGCPRPVRCRLSLRRGGLSSFALSPAGGGR